MQKDLNKIRYLKQDLKMAEIGKNSQAQGFMSKSYDGIKVMVDNLSIKVLKKNINSPTRRLKMLKS